MNPYTGQTFELGADLTSVYVPVGQMMDMERFQQRLATLEREATADELEAASQPALVAVTAEAHQRAVLGGRELARRKTRRTAAKASRKRNRS